MLHDSPDLVINRTEIWAVWRPQVGRKKVCRFLTHVRGAVCRCTVLLEQRRYQTPGLPWGLNFNPHTHPIMITIPMGIPIPTAALPDTLRITGSSMTSLWCRKGAWKKSVTDITRISWFVTTMVLTALDWKTVTFRVTTLQTLWNSLTFGGTRHVKCYSYRARTSVTVSCGGRNATAHDQKPYI